MVVAAGSGSRLDAGVPKAFVELAGRTLLEHALTRVVASGVVDEVVAVVPPTHLGMILRPRTREGPPPRKREVPPDVRTVPGGATRQASVRRGLAALPAGVDVVLVHDAARCLAPPALLAEVAAAVRAGHPAVVPALPVPDTLRSVDGGTVDRGRLRAVQTPQGFARDVLEQAHASAADDETATDDAGLVERLGVPVHLVPGAAEAFKVTSRLDLLLAQAVLAAADPW